MTLTIVGTPIGNLGDLSPRARETLERADVVVCEDTRRTGKLFELAGIARTSRFVVANDHTEHEVVDDVLAVLAEGQRVAVVTDAGMPGVSDPGSVLVAAALDAGHDVDVVPGPTAATSALVLSGLPTARWVFEGFLPRKGRARSERLDALASELRTAVLYESPHRVGATLHDLAAADPDRLVAVARELTKLHQDVWRGSIADGAAHFSAAAPRGEVVIVLGPAARPVEVGDDDLDEQLRAAAAHGQSVRDAVDAVTEATGVSRRRVYDRAKEVLNGK